MNLAAFTLGLVGSLHCLGMCGPIAFALPVRTNHWGLKLFKYLVYNFGRITTYALLGFLISVLGEGFQLLGLQQVLSVLAGVFIVMSVFVVYKPLQNTRLLGSILMKWNHTLKLLLKKYLSGSGIAALFILGLLNGLLPCGMVYTAMIVSLAIAQPVSGMTFMMFFGIGTLPMMLGASLASNWIGSNMRTLFVRQISPVVACCVGLLLIVRGLNIQIPFVSENTPVVGVYKCH